MISRTDMIRAKSRLQTKPMHKEHWDEDECVEALVEMIDLMMEPTAKGSDLIALVESVLAGRSGRTSE